MCTKALVIRVFVCLRIAYKDGNIERIPCSFAWHKWIISFLSLLVLCIMLFLARRYFRHIHIYVAHSHCATVGAHPLNWSLPANFFSMCALCYFSLFLCVIQSALVGNILLHVFHFEWPCVDSAIVYFSFRLLPSSGRLLALFVALQMFDFIWQVTHLCHFSLLRLKYIAEIRSSIGTTIMSNRWQWNRITFRGYIIEPSHNHQQTKWMGFFFLFFQPFTLSFVWT